MEESRTEKESNGRQVGVEAYVPFAPLGSKQLGEGV